MFQRRAPSQEQAEPQSTALAGWSADPAMEMQGAEGGGNAFMQGLMAQGVSADAAMGTGGTEAKRPPLPAGALLGILRDIHVELPGALDRFRDGLAGIRNYTELIFEVHAGRTSRASASKRDHAQIRALIEARNAAAVKKSYMDFLTALPAGIVGLGTLAKSIKSVMKVAVTTAGLSGAATGGAGAGKAARAGAALGSGTTKVETALLGSISRLDNASSVLSTEIQKVAKLGLDSESRLLASKLADVNRRLNFLKGLAGNYALPAHVGKMVDATLDRYDTRCAQLSAEAAYLKALFGGFALAGGEAMRQKSEGRTLFDRVYELKDTPEGRKMRIDASLPIEFVVGYGGGSLQPYLVFKQHPVEYHVIGFGDAAKAKGVDVSAEVPNGRVPRLSTTSRTAYASTGQLLLCGDRAWRCRPSSPRRPPTPTGAPRGTKRARAPTRGGSTRPCART